MSVSTAMTAIADKIRGLLGLTGTMGLDAMASNLAVEQANIADAFEAVSNKGGTVPESQVSGNLAAAIRTISAGGLDTSDATATAEDMAEGKTAYVNGEQVTGAVKTFETQAGWTVSPKLSNYGADLSLAVATNTPYLFRAGVIMKTALTNLGDATASDVAAGKTFTSAAGLMVTGTREDSGGISIVSDGEGNVTITASGSAAITSDGNGNATIVGGVS